QAANLKNDVCDPHSWPTESWAERWARVLLLLGFDLDLTPERLATWLGQTNGEGERPGGNQVFFGLMRSSLSEFATAFGNSTRPDSSHAHSAQAGEPQVLLDPRSGDPVLAGLLTENTNRDAHRRRLADENAAEAARKQRLAPLNAAFIDVA